MSPFAESQAGTVARRSYHRCVSQDLSCLLTAALVVSALQLGGHRLGAQQPSRPTGRRTVLSKKTPTRTEVRVELLTDRRGAPLAAQRWARLFERFRVPLRIRRSLGRERTSIKETVTGKIRQVTVVGVLDRSGRILVPGKSFTPGNPTALGKWLTELGTFGARGNPTGQPAFGLSEGQFNTLFEILAQPVKRDLAGVSLSEAVRRVGLPPSLGLDTKALGPAAGAEVPARTNGPGLSRGATLAALLATSGKAFLPRRTPAGEVRIAIVNTGDGKKTWPVGWPPRLTRLRTARPLFQIVPVELEDADFLDVVDTITAKTGIPMLIDHHGLASKNINPRQLSVTVPSKKTSWFQLQKSITNPHHLTRDLRIDEAGKPFVIVTPIPLRSIDKN